MLRTLQIVAIKLPTGLLACIKARSFMTHCSFWIPHRIKVRKQLYILQPQVSESSENAAFTEACQFFVSPKSEEKLLQSNYEVLAVSRN